MVGDAVVGDNVGFAVGFSVGGVGDDVGAAVFRRQVIPVEAVGAILTLQRTL